MVLRTVGICEMGQFGKTTDSPRLPAWGLERAFCKICWGLPPVEFLKSKRQRDMMSLSYQGDWGGLFPGKGRWGRALAHAQHSFRGGSPCLDFAVAGAGM